MGTTNIVACDLNKNSKIAINQTAKNPVLSELRLFFHPKTSDANM